MKIDCERRAHIAKDLADEIGDVHFETSATIGRINGIVFRLVAVDEKRADAEARGFVHELDCCITA